MSAAHTELTSAPVCSACGSARAGEWEPAVEPPVRRRLDCGSLYFVRPLPPQVARRTAYGVIDTVGGLWSRGDWSPPVFERCE